MAEVIEEQQRSTIHKKTIPEPSLKKSRKGIWFGLIIILIIISITGAGYFLLQQLRDKQQDLGGVLSKESQQMTELTKQISGYQAQLVAIQNQLTHINLTIDNKDKNIDMRFIDINKIQNERLENTSERLSQSIQRIQRQLGKTRGDWLISDAEYLLSVASRRLQLTGDAKTSIAALKAADQRLRESGDTAVFKIRTQIATDIAAIQKIKIADIVGLYATLDMLENNVSGLELFLPYSGKAQGVAQVVKTEESSTLESMLEGIVTIRNLNQPFTAILTPEQTLFIHNQLHIKLAIVKIALVQNNDLLYQASIKDTLEWLAKNFDKNTAYHHFKTELEALTQHTIRNHFPNISQSLKMLRNIAKLHLETDKALHTNAQSGQ